MKKLKIFLLFVILFGYSTVLNAQEKTGLDGLLRSNGRFYVVIAVVVTILIGLFIYLIRLDRKISRLEKE
jgi:CcmD family protein